MVIMKKRLPLAIFALSAAFGASAQYYELANQLPQLLRPALSGSWQYKGFVDATAMAGLGHNRANILSVSTSQGFQYTSWFYMGVGLGVDVAFSNYDGSLSRADVPGYWEHGANKTGAMLPLFTDFRFTFGGASNELSAFIDLRLGATFLLGNNYPEFGNGYLSNDGQFYLRPSVGLCIPVNSSNSKQAVDLGITYQLITSANNYTWGGRGMSLNALGFTIAYEW